MDRYQLAEIVDWAGDKLRTRKRLQKVVYLLQAAGCPLDVDYTLHHYGPYSHDVAGLTNEMVGAGLLEETAESNAAGGYTYSYELSDRARQQLKELGQRSEQDNGFEDLARRLLKESLSTLEYGATIAYFQKQAKNWDEARQAAAKFKNQRADDPAMRNAEQLAREVLAHPEPA
jgi:uncharacterized protein YwgA